MKVWILKTKIGRILCIDIFCGYHLRTEKKALMQGDFFFSQVKSELKDVWQRWNKTHKAENEVYPVQVRMFDEVKKTKGKKEND